MMRKIKALAIPLLVLSTMITGCTVNRDIMFKTPTSQIYDQIPDTTSREMVIHANDIIQFRLFANDGFKMIDLVSEGGGREAQWMNRMLFNYTVEHDGQVKLPLLGRIPIGGRSIRQAELDLEQMYSQYYNRPFAQVLIVNRRVVVFPGGGGDARIVQLENNNMTMLEVLGVAGGINRRGDARRVKLFRVDNEGKRRVYQFDLSTIDGLKYADIVMQGDDVVYVEPTPELARELLQDLNPVVTLLTSIVLVIGVVRSFR
jgi:polysaccharide export outer membrane protein